MSDNILKNHPELLKNFESQGLDKSGETDFEISSEQLKFLAENIADGLIIIGKQLNIQYVSRTCFEQLGYFEPEYCFASPPDFLNIIHARDMEALWQKLRVAIEQKEQSALLVYRVKNKEGHYVSRSDTIKIKYNAHGKFCCGIVICKDLSASKQVKMAEDEAEHSLQKLAATIPGVLYQLKMLPNGTFLLPYASEGLLAVFGLQFEEVCNNAAPLFELVMPEDRKRCQESLLESFGNLTAWKQEFKIQLKDGNIKWIWTNSNPQLQPDGAILWNGFMMDVTEQKHAELLSRQKDEQLKSVSASLPGIIYQFQMHPDGRFTMPYASEGFNLIYGLSWEDVRYGATRMFSTIHPEDLPALIMSITESAAGLTSWQHEFRVIFADGHQQTISGSSIPQKEADGSILWNGFLMDISERMKIETIARQKDEQLKMIASQVPGAILQFRLKPDLSITIPFVNKGFEAIFGLNAEAVKLDAMPFFHMVLPELRKEVQQDMLASMDAMTPWMEVYPMRLPDGKVHLMSGNSTPEREADGSVLWTGFISDVTVQHEAEEKLRQSNARFKYMFEDHSAIMLLIQPESGAIENANEAASQYYGYSHQELCSMNISEINMMESRELFRLRQQTLIAPAGPMGFKHRLANGEERFVEVSSSPIDYGDRRVLYAIVHDVTEKKEADDKLKRQALELKTSNEDLENFAHLASHDLKEPLRMVTSFLGLLEKRIGAKLDDKDRQYFHFATDGANRMKVLISDLLHYSRVGSNKEIFSMVDFNEVVQYNLGVLAESIAEKNALVVVKPLPVIAANHTLINELYLNLLNNALKYSSSTSQPQIETGFIMLDEEYHFYVKDNGIGISADYHEKIFQMFQRLHSRNEYSGTGIGLALCKRIADTHQGKIWVDSELGMGSTFWFSIPKTL